MLLNIFAETVIYFSGFFDEQCLKEQHLFEIVIFNFDQLKASLLSNFIHICIHIIYIYIYIKIDPLLILYVCPLTKKLLVYNCNGRFI